MKRSFFSGSLVLANVLLGGVAWAGPGAATTPATMLPASSIACQTLSAAKDYANFNLTAPAFAADLLARAACYQLQEPAAAVPDGAPEAGFTPYKLLSGHRVWLPAPKGAKG